MSLLTTCIGRFATRCATAFLLLTSVIAATSQPTAAPALKLVLPATVDLRPKLEEWGVGPRVQGGRSTCSVFTLVGGLEFAAARKQQHGERLSVEFLNWASDQVLARPKDGGFFSELWNGLGGHGICRERN